MNLEHCSKYSTLSDRFFSDLSLSCHNHVNWKQLWMTFNQGYSLVLMHFPPPVSLPPPVWSTASDLLPEKIQI